MPNTRWPSSFSSMSVMMFRSSVLEASRSLKCPYLSRKISARSSLAGWGLRDFQIFSTSRFLSIERVTYCTDCFTVFSFVLIQKINIMQFHSHFHPPLPFQHPTCAWVSGCIPSHGEYTLYRRRKAVKGDALCRSLPYPAER